MATTLGPGTLTIGETGSSIDLSSKVNGCTIKSSKTQGKASTKLDGSQVKASVEYTYELSGNVDLDDEDGAESFFALSHADPGSEQSFSFTPNTEGVTKATGTVVIDPLDFGAGNFGDDLTSAFTFALVGAPVFTYTP